MGRPEDTEPSAGEGLGPSALLAAVARGDKDALRRLYETCVDGLYTFVFYRVGKDPALAEDVVQETFLLAMSHHGDFDERRGTLRSWVCQLSRNVIRTHLRQRRRSEEIDMWDRVDRALVEAFERMEREALAQEVLEKKEVRDLVHVTMGHLAANHRHILERKYLEDRSLAELALELGVSEDAAKSMLARARRAFRETFQTLGRTLAEVES
ncbi:MAG: RNA polymerase sigma factor [Polyangiaceae bacterium]|nr:RNA polymerase sigma factor [Polyangiaceae bacterium]